MRTLAILAVLSLVVLAPNASTRCALEAPPARRSELVLGRLAWQPGDVIESTRRLANDLELSCLVGGKLQQRFVRSDESESRTRTRIAAVRDGRIERVGVRYDLLVDRSMQPEDAQSGAAGTEPSELDALSERRDDLSGRAVDVALAADGADVRNEDGSTLERGLAQAARSRELSRANDLDTGARALERWLSGRRFEAGTAVSVPELVSLELLRGETLHQASALVVALVDSLPSDPAGSARLRLAWHLAWTADEPGQELSVDLAGHVLVERSTARVLRFDASGPVDVAGAAQAGESFVEYAGRGRMELSETRVFAREP